MTARPLSLARVVVAGAAFVDLYLRWAPQSYGRNDLHVTLRGWDASVGSLGLVLVAVVVWEALALLDRAWRPALHARVAFCLATGAGILLLASFLRQHWNAPLYAVAWGEFAYGAWLALALALLLIALGLAGLRSTSERG